MPEQPSLQIAFHPSVTPALQARSRNLIRLTRFQVSADRPKLDLGHKEIGLGLYVPPLSRLNTEVWFINNETPKTKILDSEHKRISLVEVSSKTYSYLRFICAESNPKDLVKHPQEQKNISELHELTYLAYKRLFALIKAGRFPKNIVRMWNFIPDILEHHPKIQKKDQLNSERYRQFNTGRQEAWIKHSGLDIDISGNGNNHYRVPAATGIGSAKGPLIIEALLTNNDVIDIQNPRQTNAFDYSSKYGINPPVFSRATVQVFKDKGLLFIAGTASIVGEDTKHTSDPVGQTHETFANLKALIDYKNISTYLPFKPKRLKLIDLEGVRIHLKDAAHKKLIEPIVKHYLGNKIVCFVKDDICRDGLLIEIESNGTPL